VQAGATSTTTIYLIRHAHTAWNTQRRFQGHFDVPLSDVGARQADAVAAWLRRQPLPFRALYTSDLTRAAHTAAAIGRQLALTPQLTPDLREIQCGQWAGLAMTEIEERYPGQLQTWRDTAHRFTLPGGESVGDVQRRVVAFHEGVVQRHCGEAIILVAHGVVLTALLAAVHGWDLREAWRDERGSMGNTGVTVIHWDHVSRTCSMPIFNSLAHLEDVLA
jgi:broad specificity phosphatase PhoE